MAALLILGASLLPLSACADLPPLVFIYGAGDRDTVAHAARLGATAVILTPATLDGIEFARLEGCIDVAREHGLHVVVGIPTVTHDFGLWPSTGRERYREWVTEVITRVVEHFRGNPGVVAWATGDFLEHTLDTNEADFRVHLQRQYGEVPALNAWWGSAFGSLGEISQAAARELDVDLPFRTGRASVDVADFRRQAFHDVMQHWARMIKALDASRPLMTGRVSLYRDLTAVPAEYDVVCPFVPPDALDQDSLTHNVQAVDIARRAGKFEVIPALQVPLTEEEYATGDLARWMTLAALHGARGVGLADWERVTTGPAPRVTLENLERTLNAFPVEQAFQAVPRPTVAFLYQPYAAGSRRGEDGVYGYLDDFPYGQPTNPFFAFRLGTRYGLADYLVLEDLPLTDLDTYGVVFAPTALRLPAAVEAQLYAYVQRGGALVTDVGAGMVETGTWMDLPPDLARLAGVVGFLQGRETVGDLRIMWKPPWLPSLETGTRTEGSYRSGRSQEEAPATERRGYHVAGFVAYAEVAEGATPVGTSGMVMVDRVRGVAGLLSNRVGLGTVAFATHRLWAHWNSADPAYEAFHHDHCRRRAAVELLDAPFWTGGVCATATDRGVTLANALSGAEVVDVITYEAEHALHTDAVCRFSALARHPDGTRSGAARLTVLLPPLSLAHCSRLPILVQPYALTCLARVVEHSPRRLVLEVAGHGADISYRRDGTPVLGRGEVVEVRITVGDGAYPVAPGSKHRVTVDRGRQGSVQGDVTAGPQGELRFSEAISHATVTVTPPD